MESQQEAPAEGLIRIPSMVLSSLLLTRGGTNSVRRGCSAASVVGLSRFVARSSPGPDNRFPSRKVGASVAFLSLPYQAMTLIWIAVPKAPLAGLGRARVEEVQAVAGNRQSHGCGGLAHCSPASPLHHHPFRCPGNRCPPASISCPGSAVANWILTTRPHIGAELRPRPLRRLCEDTQHAARLRASASLILLSPDDAHRCL